MTAKLIESEADAPGVENAQTDFWIDFNRLHEGVQAQWALRRAGFEAHIGQTGAAQRCWLLIASVPRKYDTGDAYLINATAREYDGRVVFDGKRCVS